MESALSVLVHESRFPGRARAAYLKSFRERRMNHQFHYDTEKQAQRWLAIHEAYSPARTDSDCLQTYARAFSEINKSLNPLKMALISLGCGGGQKDVELLRATGGASEYFPADVSSTLALTAHFAVTKEFPRQTSRAVALDLAEAKDLANFLTEAPRLIAFFGMLPNFEPHEVLPQLAASLRADDFLLVSANLAPGSDYRAGVEKVFPQYNNDLTRQWLATVLQDAGLEVNAADLEFRVAEGIEPLLRIEAGYNFQKPQTIRIDDETFSYAPGDWFRLFFSYRHTPQLLGNVLGNFGIQILQQWITHSEQEGIFLCRKTST
jgi:L-histidine N-alpha-methyltransferase